MATEDEKDTRMSDQAISVLQNQINDLQRRNAEVTSNYERVKRSRDGLKKENAQLTQVNEEMNESMQKWEEMLPEVKQLSEQIEEWQPIIEEYEESKVTFSELVKERDGLQEELSTLKSSYQDLSSQYNEARAQLALPPDEANAKLQETNQKLAKYYHEQAWAQAIADLKDKDGKAMKLQARVNIPKVWSEIGYAPEGESPEAAIVEERLKFALEECDYLFTYAESANGNGAHSGEAPKPREPRPPGPGAPRGSTPTDSGVVTVDKDFYNSSKPMFMKDQRKIYEALTGGTLREANEPPPSGPRRK